MADFSNYSGAVGAGLGARVALPSVPMVGTPDNMNNALTRFGQDLQLEVLAEVDRRIKGGSCSGGGGNRQDGLLLNAGNFVNLAGPGPFSIVVNVQGRPIYANKLQAQASALGLFYVTNIDVGANTLNFGSFAPSFALDPANQATDGIDLIGPQPYFEGATTMTISGVSTIAGAHTIAVALFSLDREAYDDAGGSCRTNKRK
jgi:hypothetical protein